jgi:hypothetical protein
MEQQGHDRTKYGKETLTQLCPSLTAEFGRGFSRANLEYMGKFHLLWRDRVGEISQKPSGKSPPEQIRQKPSGKSAPISQKPSAKLPSAPIRQKASDELSAISEKPSRRFSLGILLCKAAACWNRSFAMH